MMTLPSTALLFGPHIEKDGTRFRFWAPGEKSVGLVIDDEPAIPMRPGTHGWFELLAPCSVGARYRFELSDGLLVPDPASRFQPEGVHGPSLVTDPKSYVWQTEGWKGRPWTETVLYELHVGALGGYRGVEEKLQSLADLGITAIELMPVSEFPGDRGWGYDGVLPYSPSRAYGTPDELKRLIDKAHSLGLMVFLDVVYNHFGPDGNYIGRYAPSFYRKDRHTPWGDGIDFERPEVRRYFIENALYWLKDFRFDGLRFDAVQAIGDDGFLKEMSRAIRGEFAADRHIHLVLENENNTASLLTGPYDGQWNDDGHHILHHLLTGEADGYYIDYANEPAQRLARFLESGFIYQGDHSGHKGGPRGTPSGDLPPTAFVTCIQNHDQIGNRPMGDRLITLTDPEKLKAATALILLSPQIPMLFMGEEWGSQTPFLYFTDHGGDLAEAVREGRRREFKSFPGFSNPSARETIPDPNALATFERSKPDTVAEEKDPIWRTYYADLLKLRHQHIIPALRGTKSLGATPLGDKGAVARWKLGSGEVLTLAVNFADTPVAWDLPEGSFLFATSLQTPADAASGALTARSLIALLEPA